MTSDDQAHLLAFLLAEQRRLLARMAEIDAAIADLRAAGRSACYPMPPPGSRQPTAQLTQQEH
jgi:hypothetical protein